MKYPDDDRYSGYDDAEDLPYPIPGEALIIGVPERTDDYCAVCDSEGPWIWVLIGRPTTESGWRGCLCSDCFDAYCPDDPEVDVEPPESAS